jgi:hypothetical protein
MEAARENLKTNPDLESNKALQKAHRSEWTKELRRLQGLSQIRRGQQGRGAHEPDVVSPTHWWIETGRLGDGALAAKLAQGERDATPPWTTPVAIVRQTGSPVIRAMLRLDSLIEALGEDTGWAVPQWSWDIPVVIPYERWLEVVKRESEHDRREH